MVEISLPSSIPPQFIATKVISNMCNELCAFVISVYLSRIAVVSITSQELGF